MKKWTESDFKLQQIRWANLERKRSKRPKRGRKKITLHSKNLARLSAMSKPKKPGRFRDMMEVDYIVPKVFSMIKNPRESIQFIARLARAVSSSTVRSIYIDHSSVIYHDLAAEILLGVTAREVKKAAALRNVNVVIRGRYPRSKRMERLIYHIGVVQKLNIIDESMYAADGDAGEQNEIEIFNFSGFKDPNVPVGSEDSKNRCARMFVEYVNRCLGHNERKLTDDSKQNLLDFLGEIVGNAEDHSGESRWYVCAYLDDTNDNATGEHSSLFCEIVIYNFGKSIAQTFLDLEKDSLPIRIVSPYIETHMKKSLFASGWNKEDLLTLVALQSHISSKNRTEDDTRGQGTVDLIEFFHNVARECTINGSKSAQMALISGNTHILFDDKYRLQKNDDGREIIAFNATNDLNVKPDTQYVQGLSGVEFPGTLIGIKFPVRSGDTEAVDSESNESVNE